MGPQDTLLPASWEQAGQQLGTNLGIAGRGLAQGSTGLVTMIADPATKLLNMVLPQDWQQLPPSQGLAHILDRLGVPNAQTASQQVLEGAMSGMSTGGAVAGVAKSLSPIAQGVVKKYLDIIGGNVGNQMLSGMTTGAAGTGAYT